MTIITNTITFTAAVTSVTVSVTTTTSSYGDIVKSSSLIVGAQVVRLLIGMVSTKLVASLFPTPHILAQVEVFDWLMARQDGTLCLLDSRSGRVQFGEYSTVEFPRSMKSDTAEYRDFVVAVLTRVSEMKRFHSCPLELQNHIGSLRQVLRVSQGETS